MLQVYWSVGGPPCHVYAICPYYCPPEMKQNGHPSVYMMAAAIFTWHVILAIKTCVWWVIIGAYAMLIFLSLCWQQKQTCYPLPWGVTHTHIDLICDQHTHVDLHGCFFFPLYLLPPPWGVTHTHRSTLHTQIDTSRSTHVDLHTDLLGCFKHCEFEVYDFDKI